MGLLDLAGLGNTPFGQFVDQNQYKLGALGAGLAGGTSLGGGLALGLQNMQQARLLDQQRGQQAADEQMRQTQINQTMKWIQDLATANPNNPQLAQIAQGLNMGAIETGPAFTAALQAMKPAPAPTTDDIKEFDLARQQGYQGSFMDYMTDMKKAGATNVTTNVGGGKYGTIPQGYMLKEGPEGAFMEPIPGGPAAQEAEQTAQAKQAAQAQAATYADIVTSDIDKAAQLITTSKIPMTGVASFTSAIPGTPAHDVARLLDTVRANVGFDRLQQMRNASPTGGALGQVSEFENRLLQATIGNLEQSQSKEQLLRNLDRVKRIYSKIVNEGISPDDPEAREALNGDGGGVVDYTDYFR